MATESRAVMLWRRIEDLGRAKAFASDVLGWPLVGEDSYSVMFDGGGALVGWWLQDEPKLRADDSCSELNFLKYALVVNPASQMLVGAPQLSTTLRRLNAFDHIRAVPRRTPAGQAVVFYDEAGNLSVLSQPSVVALRGRAGSKVRALLRPSRRGDTALARRARRQTTVTGVRLLVSDLQRSQQFYRSVVGLSRLAASRDEVTLGAGSVTVSLQSEPAAGMLRSLRKSSRLLGNWLVLHTGDIRGTVEGLKRRRVEFPRGVEESGVGLMAYFQDPDGHTLVLWQPSGAPTKLQPIDFYPVLDRLLSA